jgi:hypothetical protein
LSKRQQTRRNAPAGAGTVNNIATTLGSNKDNTRAQKGPSTSPTREAGATTSYFSKMATGCRVLNISPYVIEFPTLEMQEQVQ